MSEGPDAVKLFARPRREASGRVAGPGWRAMLHYQLVDHAILRHLWTNMDEVAPGVWRSNQPTHARFRALKAMGIRTVVSLRGDGKASFQVFARESCAALGLRQVSVALRSRRAPERAEVLRLFEAFRTAEKPFLIHCKSGADRSGFAAALYLLTQGATVAESKRQLSWRYLHLKSSRAGVLGHVLDLYATRLREGPIGIEEWFRTEYDADAAQAGFRA